MKRRTGNELMDCADCGKPMDLSIERGYRAANDWALCSDCARERGAQFDEMEDRWRIAPDITGLPFDREHRVR